MTQPSGPDQTAPSPPATATNLTALQRAAVTIEAYKKRPRVLLIERHDHLRTTLVDALNTDRRISEVVPYNDRLANLTRFLALSPDTPQVVVSSLRVHGGTVFDLALTLWLPYPHVRVVGYVTTPDELTPTMADRAEECGVTMVVLGSSAPGGIGTAVRAAFIESEASALGLQRRPLFHADYLQRLKEHRAGLRRRAAGTTGTAGTAGSGRPGVAS